MLIQELQPFAVSLIIGLLIGIERERSHPPQLLVLGVRSFVFIALLGTLAVWFNQPTLTIVLTVFVFAMIFVSYLRVTQRTKRQVGITTELAGGIVYFLGYMTTSRPLLAVILGVTILLLLVGSKRLHEFSRHQITPSEIQAAVIILVLAFCILPFLPNHTIDPWQLFNPQQLGIILVLLSCLQFAGYVALLVFGDRLGMIFLGFFGGLISSIAMFVTLPKIYSEDHALLRPAVAAALFATVAMLLEVIVTVAIISSQLLVTLIWPIIAAASVGVVLSLLITLDQPRHHIPPNRISPLHFKSVLELAAIIFGMIIFVAAATNYLGTQGGVLASFLGGLVVIQSASLAAATLFSEGKITLQTATQMLALALIASATSKFFLLAIARNRFAIITAVGLALMLISGYLTFLFVH